MKLFLGVDVGGSRTRALIADGEGRALGYGETGAGSHEMVGYKGLREAAERSSLQAIRRAGAAPKDIVCMGAGVAGYDWPSERETTLEALSFLGTSCPIMAVNDSALGLAAVADEGINLTAGTSNNCYGRWKGRTGSLAGAGFPAGEEGGAMEIALLAYRAINHERIRRGPATAVTRAVLDTVGLRDSGALVEAITQGRLSIDPGWATLVFRAFREGDSVAESIVRREGRELGESALAVMRQIGLDLEPSGTAFDLVLSGSLFKLEPALSEEVEAVVRPSAPGGRLVPLECPPVVGAVALAMIAMGDDAGPARTRLADSLRARALE